MCVRYDWGQDEFQIWDPTSESFVNLLDDEALIDSTFPGSRSAIVKLDERHPVLAHAQWGLTPFWAKTPKWGRQNAYNARAETVAEKPTFRPALKSRRCLVPAIAFYERAEGYWWRFAPKNGSVMAFAGLYEEANKVSDAVTFAYVTTEPNNTVIEFHDRMPVILSREDYDLWLDPKADTKDLIPLLTPAPTDLLAFEKAEKVGAKRT